MKCDFCLKDFDESKLTVIYFTYDSGNTGTYTHHFACRNCKNLLKGRIDRAIHATMSEQRKVYKGDS